MIERVLEILSSSRIPWRDETDLQEGVETLFKQSGLAYQREFHLSERDRPDFMVGTIAVECKVDGSGNDVLRQLHRYAEHDSVEILVLVTTCAKHRMPEEIRGKPVYTVRIISI